MENRLEDAYYLSSIKANNDTKKLAKLSIFISVIALVGQLMKGSWIENLYLYNVLEKKGNLHYMPFIINNYEQLLMVLFLTGIVIVAIIVFYSKYEFDSYQVGFLRALPIICVFFLLGFGTMLFKEPLPLGGFLIAIGITFSFALIIVKLIVVFIGYFKNTDDLHRELLRN